MKWKEHAGAQGTSRSPGVIGEAYLRERNEALDLLEEAEYGGPGGMAGRSLGKAWEEKRLHLLALLRVKDQTVRERVEKTVGEYETVDERDLRDAIRILADAIDELREGR